MAEQKKIDYTFLVDHEVRDGEAKRVSGENSFKAGKTYSLRPDSAARHHRRALGYYTADGPPEEDGSPEVADKDVGAGNPLA